MQTGMTAKKHPGVGRILPLITLLAVTLACANAKQAGERAAFDSGLPTMRTTMKVVSVANRGGYLDVQLTFAGRDNEAFAEPSDDCLVVFEVGADVQYVDDGPRGRYRRGEVECQSIGMGNLEMWRDRSTRSTSASQVIPRARTDFNILYEDDEVVMLRGNFPLASRLGFTVPRDIVAIVPADDRCKKIAAGLNASMEYRPRGTPAYALVGSDGLCRIRGFSTVINPQGR